MRSGICDKKTLESKGFHDFVLDHLCRISSFTNFAYTNIDPTDKSLKDLKSLLGPKQYDVLCTLFCLALEKFKLAQVSHGTSKKKPNDVFFNFKNGWTLIGDQGPSFLGKIDMMQPEKISIGLYSYFSGASKIDGSHDVSIGSFCSIASDQFFFSSSRDHPSQYPSSFNFHTNSRVMEFGDSIDIDFNPRKKTEQGITIKNDVWMGRNCTIMSGVIIANGCIIGANSTVTKNTEPFGVYVGNPAKLIRKRFPQEIIDVMLDVAWWDWDFSTIKKNRKFLNLNLEASTPDQLLEAIELNEETV